MRYDEMDGHTVLVGWRGTESERLVRLLLSDTATDDEGLGMGFARRTGADVFTQPLGPAPRLYKRREKGERYFGCGERTSGLEKTGSYQIFWNVDPPLGHTPSFNNLYSSIPFALSMTSGRAHGL